MLTTTHPSLITLSLSSHSTNQNSYGLAMLIYFNSTCVKVKLHLTEEMVLAVESATRDQSHSKLRFKYGAGRITASRMK